MSAARAFHRRRFLRGLGGVTLGLPFLESFLPRRARAQTAARPPFLLIVVNGNGVVQAGKDITGSADPETFWPMATGALTSAGLDGIAAARTTGLLSSHASRLLMVRGVDHPFAATGCQHASGDLQLLTATRPSGNGNQAVATGESIDTRIARELNPPGRDPLVLHAGKYAPGGTGFDIPGYVSYIGSKQPRTYLDGPYKAYQRIIGVVGGGGSSAEMQAQQLLANRSKSVNDLLRGQIQSLLRRTDLSGSDVTRLNEHFAAIRDIEVKMAAAGVTSLPAADVTSMQTVDPKPYDLANHQTLVQLHMELMAFAVASDYTRVAVLKIGDREDDSTYTLGGVNFVYHTASHRAVPNGAELCRQIDRLHAGFFKGLLDRLAAYGTATGPLVDQGIAVLTNQVASGNHSFVRVPWILSVGQNTTYLKKGQFADVGSVKTNQMLNTLLNAVGLRKTGGAPVDDFGDASLPKGVVSAIVA